MFAKFTRKKYLLETGASMLEAVVVVAVLLALAIGGFHAYGAIADNAKRAHVKSTASTIHTAVLAADTDADPATTPDAVVSNWNASSDKVRVELLDTTAAPAAMTTASTTASTSGDYCVQATSTSDPTITSSTGDCPATEGTWSTYVELRVLPTSNTALPNTWEYTVTNKSTGATVSSGVMPLTGDGAISRSLIGSKMVPIANVGDQQDDPHEISMTVGRRTFVIPVEADRFRPRDADVTYTDWQITYVYDFDNPGPFEVDPDVPNEYWG